MSAEALETTNKLAFEWLKHLTTLSFGAIVIIGALLERLFTEPLWTFLIPVFFVSLFLTTVGAVLLMLDLLWGRVSAMPQYKQPRDEELQRVKLFVAGVLFTIGFFLVGVLGFVVFAVRNLI